MPRPRLLILCGRSPRHLYVANRLGAVAEVLAIVHEVDRWDLARLRKLLRPRSLWSKVWRWLRDRRRYQDAGEARFFFGPQTPALDRPDLVRTYGSINDPALAALAAELQPDLIAVFGTTLIRGPLLQQGRLGMVNLHGGLSPAYRGADCTFWALYNGEPDQVGCTLHYIDAGIDTGRLIAHIQPAVGPGDDELTLFWRGVRDSAEVYAQFVERAAAGEHFGVPQPDPGRLYRVRDRLLRHERDLDRRLPSLLADVDLPPRVTWFQPRNGS